MSLPAILVVEDDANDQKVIIDLLTKFDFSGEIATSVDDTLAALRSHKFAVILINMDMPGADFQEFVRQIKQVELEHTTQTPIIGLGAGSDEVCEKLALSAELDGYIKKPLASEDLRRMLLRHAYEPRKPNLKTLRPLTGEDSLPGGG